MLQGGKPCNTSRAHCTLAPCGTVFRHCPYSIPPGGLLHRLAGHEPRCYLPSVDAEKSPFDAMLPHLNTLAIRPEIPASALAGADYKAHFWGDLFNYFNGVGHDLLHVSGLWFLVDPAEPSVTGLDLSNCLRALGNPADDGTHLKVRVYHHVFAGAAGGQVVRSIQAVGVAVGLEAFAQAEGVGGAGDSPLLSSDDFGADGHFAAPWLVVGRVHRFHDSMIAKPFKKASTIYKYFCTKHAEYP